MNIDVPIEEEVNEDPVTHLEFVPVVTPGGIIHERIEGNEIQIKITKEWENVPNEASPEATLELYDTSTGIVIETITLTKENTETTVTVPQRSDGTLINYGVREVALVGYDFEVVSYTPPVIS